MGSDTRDTEQSSDLVIFKVDTGAEVNALSESTWNSLGH